MIRIITIVGARPQFVKASALSRAIMDLQDNRIEEILIHTGQHYDVNMSKIFFDELEIPMPKYNLGIGSLSHSRQTGEMIMNIENILISEKPNAIIVYGDTNSTLAASLAAVKLHIPVFHVEAGLRSFNKSMPEEINRIATDHFSTLLFCPTDVGINNLLSEGFKKNNSPYFIDNPGIFKVGDVMYDNALHYSNRQNLILEKLNIKKDFILTTIHRPVNTDVPQRLSSIITVLLDIAHTYNLQILMPLHPRTKKILEEEETALLTKIINDSDNFLITPPLSYLEMLTIEKNAQIIITDSGGVQKEAWFFNKPLIILRKETEWIEIVDSGNGVLVDADASKIKEAVNKFIKNPPQEFPDLFGNGDACKKILDIILNQDWS